MSRHVLLTGVEPFRAHPVKPSELLARGLEGRIIGDRIVEVRALPADTRRVRDRLASTPKAPDTPTWIPRGTARR